MKRQPKRALVVFRKSQSELVKKAFHQYLPPGTIVDYVVFDEAVFDLSPDNGKVWFGDHALDEYDLVYFRSLKSHKVFYDAIMALYPKLPLLQRLTSPNYSSKLLQYACFARDNASFPHTYFMATNNDRLYARKLIKVFSFPFVIKPLVGSKGDNAYLVHTKTELNHILSRVRKEGISVLAQEHIPNTHDYRVVIVEDKVALSFKRIRNHKAEWRNNVALGASYKHISTTTLDPKIKELARKGKKALGWRFAGMDVVKNEETGVYYLFEGNSHPSFVLGQEKVIVGLAAKMLKKPNRSWCQHKNPADQLPPQ